MIAIEIQEVETEEDGIRSIWMQSWMEWFSAEWARRQGMMLIWEWMWIVRIAEGEVGEGEEEDVVDEDERGSVLRI
jgi:hypothetical protein